MTDPMCELPPSCQLWNAFVAWTIAVSAPSTDTTSYPKNPVEPLPATVIVRLVEEEKYLA